MAGRQSAAQNLPKFTLKMKDERMKDIVTVFQYFILSQNFLAELCHERYQDKICEEGRGDETSSIFRERDPDWSNAIRKR